MSVHDSASRSNHGLLTLLDNRVALSGIVNTISPSTRAFSFTSAIKADSLVVALDEKDVALAELMNELLETYCPGHEEDPFAPLNFWSLRIKVWSQLAELGATPPATRNMKRRVAVLQVVDHICTLISTNHLALPTTEHVIVSVWSFILAVMLGGQIVRGIPWVAVRYVCHACLKPYERYVC